MTHHSKQLHFKYQIALTEISVIEFLESCISFHFYIRSCDLISREFCSLPLQIFNYFFCNQSRISFSKPLFPIDWGINEITSNSATIVDAIYVSNDPGDDNMRISWKQWLTRLSVLHQCCHELSTEFSMLLLMMMILWWRFSFTLFIKRLL